MSEESLINPLDEAFKNLRKGNKEISKELFISPITDEEEQLTNTDLKSDVEYPEDVYISSLKIQAKILKDAGIQTYYTEYIEHLLRIRFSLDRKSRSEFVDINTKQYPQFTANEGQFDSIKEVRK